MENIIRQRIQDSINIKKSLLSNHEILEKIGQTVLCITKCIRSGGKLVICGNGGSASDALHFAGEIVGRFQKERNPWPAIVLNADVATLTAIANDYGYEEVFAKQTIAFLRENDVFIGISTSGNSNNVLKAVNVAKNLNVKSIALLGKDGGKIGKMVDYPILVPFNITARVQESHIMIIHIICELVEDELTRDLKTNYV